MGVGARAGKKRAPPHLPPAGAPGGAAAPVKHPPAPPPPPRRLAAGEAAGEADRQDQPRLRSAAVTVFFISMAIVIGPTPPGTGVIAPATSLTRAKSTSPTVA